MSFVLDTGFRRYDEDVGWERERHLRHSHEQGHDDRVPDTGLRRYDVLAPSGLDEIKNLLVHDVRLRGDHAVRQVPVRFQRSIFQ